VFNIKRDYNKEEKVTLKLMKNKYPETAIKKGSKVAFKIIG